MEKNDYIQWLIQWFQENESVNSIDIESDFFANGLLGSLQTLKLVIDIESSFQLSLPDSALTNSKFSSINGLATILSELINAKDISYVE